MQNPVIIPLPASPKIAPAILGEVQVGVIGIAYKVLILSRTHVKKVGLYNKNRLKLP